MVGVIFMFLMVFSLVFCGFFITCRFDCNRCGSDFQRVKDFKLAHKQALWTMLVLVGLYAVSSIVVSIFNYFSFSGIYDSVMNFEEEVSNLEINFRDITNTINNLVGSVSAGDPIYADLKVVADFRDIQIEISKIRHQSISFSDSAYAYEVVLFSWIWLQLFFTLIAIVVTIIGSTEKKSNLMVILGTVLLYVFLITHLAYLACLSSEIFIVADICEQMYSVVTFNSVPNTELGLAYYFKPFSYEAIGNTLAQSYLVASAYDSVMEAAIADLHENCKGEVKTRQDYEDLILRNYTCIRDNSKVGRNRDALQKLNVVISQLYDMRYYRNLRKFSRDSEWPLCVRTLNAFPYLFYGMVACTFLLMLITITSTRMITVTNKRIYENLSNV